MPVSDVAWAAGFGSIRQFNDRVREVYALTPTQLRAASIRTRPVDGGPTRPGWITARLAVRPPFDVDHLLEFLGRRAIPGVESYDGATYRRAMRLPRGQATISIPRQLLGGSRPFVTCQMQLEDVRDYAVAVARVRGLLDLDADPVAVTAALVDDPVLAPLVAARPGLRVPGAVDGAELAFRAVLGQQISVGAARMLAGKLTEMLGEPLAEPDGELRRQFPDSAIMAAADPAIMPMPASRAAALGSLARALDSGRLALDPGVDRDETTGRLERLPGIGRWTADYVRMRALGDPDVLLSTDLAVSKALRSLPGGDDTSGDLWKPWRSYATVHLWATPTTTETRRS
jgi:AraC family transcriptional regulator of adaptative response / DNA-3-methyladenine glycosylase II